MGPAERVHATTVARQYYLEGMTKVEIAQEHGLSRYKVARILDKCRAEGLVTVRIEGGSGIDVELSERLRREYGLRNAVVVPGDFPDEAQLRVALGHAAADLLREILEEEDVLGVAWGRTIDLMADDLHDLPRSRVVQMTGIAGDIHSSSVDLVRRLASATHGPSHPIYAPLIVSDAEALQAIHRQRGIQEAMTRWNTITVAAVAVGSWDPHGSQVHDVLTPEDRMELEGMDVACEICAIPLDHSGQPLRTGLTRRTMGISYAELESIPQVIAVAGGVAKTEAIRAALRSTAISSVVTDAAVARGLLADTSMA